MEDGTSFDGIGFGYPSATSGEVVFNTGMVGYTETLTDPSYSGQILCMTYPLVGNYGVPSMEVKDEFGLPKFFESDKIQVKGLIIHDLSDVASHWSITKTLDEWLYEEKIPGIFGIDTRELTKRLRVNGVMRGAMHASISQKEEESLAAAAKSAAYEGLNFMTDVSATQPIEYGDRSKDCIVVIDTGVKYSIIRNILRTGYRVVRLPWNASYQQIVSYDPKGVVISNGPGDPKVCSSTIKTAAELLKTSTPTLGICLGNQILALAGGANTYKLKFGHRGQNKPCLDRQSSQVYVTSQNHGYGIDPKTMKKSGFEVWFENADDGTIEGIRHSTKPVIAVQFHPEASPGPYDCMFVFDRFKEIITENAGMAPKADSEKTTRKRRASKDKEGVTKSRQEIRQSRKS